MYPIISIDYCSVTDLSVQMSGRKQESSSVFPVSVCVSTLTYGRKSGSTEDLLEVEDLSLGNRVVWFPE